ncbi:MAG: glycosyltransferase family 2 protein, partial [Actinobacteria bacterium]|nr:glycosyltransferase family 2 protein [Actinomycetota bacterium]
SGSEFSMRVRVSLRALWALKDTRQLMNPLRGPLFAWQLISHKLLRYTAFVPLITLAISTVLLAPARGIYTLAFIGLVIFTVLAWTGHRREGQGQSLSVIYSIPYYFMLLNIASYKATAAFLKGEKKVIWNPRKG